MSDSDTSVAELRQMVAGFVGERNWQVFHAPKNLSMALAVEAAELMEHFQWLSVDESRAIPPEGPQHAAIADELADIVCYALALANEMQIDLSDAMRAKMVKNIAKYPAGEYRGRYEKPPE